MKNNITLHIPQPCHENWQQMTPADKGRFCQSCAKQVVDFTLMSDRQVLDYITKAAGGVCGRFANDQLQRPLVPVKQEKKKVWWMAALMPLMLLAGKAGAQKKKQIVGDTLIVIQEMAHTTGLVGYVGDVESNQINLRASAFRKKGQESFTINGRVTDKQGIGIPQGRVVVKESKTTAITDDKGFFILTGSSPANHITLNTYCVGCEPAEVTVSFIDTGEAAVKKTYTVNGTVFGEDAPYPISFASISLAGVKNNRCSSDASGKFKFVFTTANSSVSLIISSVGFEDKIIPIELYEDNYVIDLDTIKCKPSVSVMGDIVVGGVSECKRPKKTDTFPPLFQKLFHNQPFKLFPNPAPRGTNITVDVKNAGLYTIQLFDNNGRLLQNQEFNAGEGATQTLLPIPASLAAGIYFVRMVDGKTQKQQTDKIVIQ